MVDDDIQIPAMHIVFADQLRLIGLIDRRLQALALAHEFAANIDVAGMRAHREAGDQAALNQMLRIVAHNVAILAGAGLRFIGIDHKVMRPLLHLFRHEGPFQAGRKTRAAASSQSGFLDDIDNRLGALLQDRFGAIPRSALARGIENSSPRSRRDW